MANGWAYLCHLRDGLYRVSVEEKEKFFSKVWGGNVPSVVSSGDQVYFLFNSSEDKWVPRVIKLDARTAKVTGSVQLPFGNVRLTGDRVRDFSMFTVISGLPHLSVALGNQQGLVLVDFEKNKILWHVGMDEKWEVKWVTATPYGLVVLAKIGEERKIFFLDEMTGRFLSPPKLKSTPTDLMFWTGDQLLINTCEGLEMFVDDGSNSISVTAKDLSQRVTPVLGSTHSSS